VSFADGFVQESALNDPFLSQARRYPSSTTARAETQLRLSGESDGLAGPTTPSSMPTVDFGHASRYVQVDSVPKTFQIDDLNEALSVGL
jgi:hypothetical protein